MVALPEIRGKLNPLTRDLKRSEKTLTPALVRTLLETTGAPEAAEAAEAAGEMGVLLL